MKMLTMQNSGICCAPIAYQQGIHQHIYTTTHIVAGTRGTYCRSTAYIINNRQYVPPQFAAYIVVQRPRGVRVNHFFSLNSYSSEYIVKLNSHA